MRVLLTILVAGALAGCWDVNSQRCDDVLCPVDTQCFSAESVCVPPDKLCDQQEDTPCLFGELQESDGLCIGGLCRPFQCKAPIVPGRELTLDAGEECELDVVASCLDFGFDRGVVGCDDECQNNVSSCGGIGWDSQTRGGGYTVGAIAESPVFTLASGVRFGQSPILRRAAGDELFEFVDASPLVLPLSFGVVTDLAVDGANVITVGQDGLVATYDGTDWDVEIVGSANWFGVAANGALLHVVGSGTAVAKRVAGTWIEEVVVDNDPRALSDLWLEDEENGVAVGGSPLDGGIIARLEAGTWSEFIAPIALPALGSVAAITPEEIYVAGVDGFLARLEGDQLTQIQTGTNSDIFSLEASGAELFVGTADGELLRFDGDSLLDISPIDAVIGALEATTTGLIAGSENSFHEHRGMAWAHHESPPIGNLHEVFATSSGDLLIVRSRGVFGPTLPALSFDGLAFSAADGLNMSANELARAWGRSGQFFAAKGTTLYELTGGVWIEMGDFDEAVGAITGDESRLFVVGEAGMLVDTSTGSMESGTNVNLTGAHTASGLPLYVVGESGFFARVDDGVATPIASGVDVALRDVFAAGLDDVYLVGDDNTLLHYDGADVQRIAMPLRGGTPLIAQSLLSIHGTSSSDIFAVSNEGLILHFDGASWTLVRSPAGALESVFVLPTVVTFVGPDSEFHQLVRPAP